MVRIVVPHPRQNDTLPLADNVGVYLGVELLQVWHSPPTLSTVEEHIMSAKRLHLMNQFNENPLVMSDGRHCTCVVDVSCKRSRCCLGMKGKPIVKYQLNRKKINDKATKRLVNLPKRVWVNGLTAGLRSTAFFQQQHEGIGKSRVVRINAVRLQLEMAHELKCGQHIPAVIGRSEHF